MPTTTFLGLFGGNPSFHSHIIPSTMPEIFEPSPNSARRPVLGTSALNANRRRRRKFPIAAMDVASVDDLEFTLQNSPVHLSHSNTTTTRKVHAKATTGNRTPLSHFLPPFARSTPISLPSITPQRNLVQQSLPSTPSTRKATLSHVRRALLIDTRTLDTNQGRAIGNSFASQTRSFLASLRRRGMVPNLLISLETSSINSDRNRPPMITKTLRPLVDSHVSMDGMCEPMLVKHAVRSHNHTKKGQAIMIPTRFLANASWTVFGDLGMKRSCECEQLLRTYDSSSRLSFTFSRRSHSSGSNVTAFGS